LAGTVGGVRSAGAHGPGGCGERRAAACHLPFASDRPAQGAYKAASKGDNGDVDERQDRPSQVLLHPRDIARQLRAPDRVDHVSDEQELERLKSSQKERGRGAEEHDGDVERAGEAEEHAHRQAQERVFRRLGRHRRGRLVHPHCFLRCDLKPECECKCKHKLKMLAARRTDLKADCPLSSPPI
jgi:hypothetical protein